MARTTGSLPSWLPFVNRVVRGLSRLGTPLGRVRVLTVPGRVSGEPRSTPVTPLTVADRRYVVSVLPRSDWARNIRAAGHGELAHGRRRSAVTLTEVTDPGEAEAVLREFPRLVPDGVPFFIRLGLVERADPDQFAATVGRVAIFRMD